MELATLQFETCLQKCIRIGITIIFKIFIWEGISSDKPKEIVFIFFFFFFSVKSLSRLTARLVYDRNSDDIPPQVKILNMVIP